MNVSHLTLPEARGLRETMAENAGIQHAEMARALAALLEIRPRRFVTGHNNRRRHGR